MGFIKPVEVLLKTTCTAPDDCSDDMNVKSSFGYFIPIEKSFATTLKSIPSNIDLYSNQKPKKHKNDFFDGYYVKNLLKPESNKLGILLYSDDLEVTNAVSSSRTKHKLSMYSFRNILFYFSFM